MRALIVDVPQGCLTTAQQTDFTGSRDLIRDASEACLQIGWEITRADSYAAALDAAKTVSFDVLFVSASENGGVDQAHRSDFDELIGLAENRRIPAVVLTDRQDLLAGSLVDTVSRSISPAELKGRLEMIERYHPVLRRMDRELGQMRNLTRRLDRQFREMDQEMRLAGRLQRDFLPNLDKPIRNTRFATVYRPTLWVSGDTFDVFRVNENLTAFYVADAVGHGMAASLLTMFIRRAIVAKQATGKTGLPSGKTQQAGYASGLPGADGYHLLTPSETLAGLNAALIDQELPDNQFVTACYMLIDHRTLTVRFASGGHPYPVVLSPDGTIRELEATGALLGVFDNAEFPTSETQLHPGDKLLIYTDGLDMAFGDSTQTPLDAFRSLAGLPIQAMMRQLESQMDHATGSLDPADDVTIVGLECLEE